MEMGINDLNDFSPKKKKTLYFLLQSVELPRKSAMFPVNINMFMAIVGVKNIITVAIATPTLCNFTRETYYEEVEGCLLCFYGSCYLGKPYFYSKYSLPHYLMTDGCKSGPLWVSQCRQFPHSFSCFKLQFFSSDLIFIIHCKIKSK